MLPRHHPDRVQITFDDHRLVATMPGRSCRPPSPNTWACPNWLTGPGPGPCNRQIQHRRQDDDAGQLPRGPGGDCIDDADVLRTGGTARTLGGTVKAPSAPWQGVCKHEIIAIEPAPPRLDSGIGRNDRIGPIASISGRFSI